MGTGFPSNSKITGIQTITGIVTFTGTTTAVIPIGTQVTIKHAAKDQTFILKEQSNRKLDSDKVLKKIPLSQNIFVSSKFSIVPPIKVGYRRSGRPDKPMSSPRRCRFTGPFT